MSQGRAGAPEHAPNAGGTTTLGDRRTWFCSARGAGSAVMDRAVRVPAGAVLARQVGLGLTDELRLRGRVRLDAVRDLCALRRGGGADESLGVSPCDLAPRRDELEDGGVVGAAG